MLCHINDYFLSLRIYETNTLPSTQACVSWPVVIIVSFPHPLLSLWEGIGSPSVLIIGSSHTIQTLTRYMYLVFSLFKVLLSVAFAEIWRCLALRLKTPCTKFLVGNMWFEPKKEKVKWRSRFDFLLYKNAIRETNEPWLAIIDSPKRTRLWKPGHFWRRAILQYFTNSVYHG